MRRGFRSATNAFSAVLESMSYAPHAARLMIRYADRGALDPIAPTIGEDVVADVPDVAAAEELPEGIVVAFLHRHDPHVDLVFPHRLGEDAVELLASDGAEALPPASCLELRLRAEVASGEGEARGDENTAKVGARQCRHRYGSRGYRAAEPRRHG